MNERVLVIGAEKVGQSRLARILHEQGYRALLAGSCAEAAHALAHSRFVFTVVDMNRNRAESIESLEPLKRQKNDPGPIILLSDNAQHDPIIEAKSFGADRVIRGALCAENLKEAIRDAESRQRRPDAVLADTSSAGELQRQIALWRSDKMQDIWKIIQRAAQVDVTVLISGETGTGKDLVARGIHHLSSRQRAPFVAVNCAAVPRDLLESELFGHERGAFTGAHQLKTGKFESAQHGTILLDEIGDLHPALQAKLLHVLQDGTFSRVGAKTATKVDVRVLAATNRDLALGVATQRFRDDLYYRLNVIHIVVPPLRERSEEIPLLAAYFVERYSKLYNRDGFELRQEAVDRLVRYRYPGNVRELENVIKRMIVLDDVQLTRTSFPAPTVAGKHNTHNGPLEAGHAPAVFLKDIARKAAQRAEREEIVKMLDRTHWNRARAAKLLNISYRSLLYKMKGGGLDRRPPAVDFGM